MQRLQCVNHRMSMISSSGFVLHCKRKKLYHSAVCRSKWHYQAAGLWETDSSCAAYSPKASPHGHVFSFWLLWWVSCYQRDSPASRSYKLMSLRNIKQPIWCMYFPTLSSNFLFFFVFQGDLQAPGLQEREHPSPGPQSPGLLPQAPRPQVSSSLSPSPLCADCCS